jgi:hypothetical protein
MTRHWFDGLLMEAHGIREHDVRRGDISPGSEYSYLLRLGLGDADVHSKQIAQRLINRAMGVFGQTCRKMVSCIDGSQTVRLPAECKPTLPG